MPNFAILRVAKIHTRRQLRDASKHNDRTAEGGLEHVEPSDDPALIAGDADVVAAWDAKMAAAGVDPKKQRKDGVVAIEWVATASPEFFATASAEQRTTWATESMAFIIDQAGGADNVLAVYLHEDETTPHIHALTIPLVKKARGAKGRPRKGREAPQKPAQEAWGLSASEFIGGGSARLGEMQTAYAEAVASTGLQRGVPRKETGARNRSPAHWRAEQARLTDESIRNKTATDLNLQKSESIRSDAVQIRAKALAEGHHARAQAQALTAKAAEGTEAIAKGVAYVEALGAVVREDAKRVGAAIHFPAYADNPTTEEARKAVADALERQAQDKAKAQAAIAKAYPDLTSKKVIPNPTKIR